MSRGRRAWNEFKDYMKVRLIFIAVTLLVIVLVLTYNSDRDSLRQTQGAEIQ